MANKPVGRYSRFSSGDTGGTPAIQEANPELIGELVAAVVGLGDAVLIGGTKDGSATRFILMNGDCKDSFYCGTAKQIDEFCKATAQTIRDTMT